MCPAIHINSRSWLRSSSTHEPSDPPLRVVIFVRSIARSRESSSRTAGSAQQLRTGIDSRHGAADTATDVRRRFVIDRVASLCDEGSTHAWAIATAIH
jgi:hypothetical protein